LTYSESNLIWDAALSKFNTDHADIAKDPDLVRVFQRHLNEVAKTSTTPHEAIEKATESVTGWLTKVSGRSGRSQFRAAPAEEYDPSAVVAEMKRARGQA